MANGL